MLSAPPCKRSDGSRQREFETLGLWPQANRDYITAKSFLNLPERAEKDIGVTQQPAPIEAIAYSKWAILTRRFGGAGAMIRRRANMIV